MTDFLYPASETDAKKVGGGVGVSGYLGGVTSDAADKRRLGSSHPLTRVSDERRSWQYRHLGGRDLRRPASRAGWPDRGKFRVHREDARR